MSTQERRNNQSGNTNIAILVVIVIALTIGVYVWKNDDDDALPPLTSTAATTTPGKEDVVSEPAITIVAFGDSITAGYGITIPEAYPQLLENALRKEGKDVRVINSGVSGETTAGGLRRAEFVAKQSPDIVIVALGGNDVLRGTDPTSVKENLRGIIKIFRDQGITVVLAGMKAPINLGPQYVLQFNKIYEELADEYNLALVPFLLEDVALDAKLNQEDMIHPNQAGAKVIAEENILPVMLQVLK